MSQRLLVATRKGLFFVDRVGGRWTIGRTAFLADNLSMVLPDHRDGWIYAAVGHGHFGVKMHRSSDGGRNWEECPAPAYPPCPDDAPEEVNPMSGKVTPWNLEMVWALEPGGPDQPGHLWCGTVPGGLFKSTDRGGSWTLVRSLWDRPERRDWFGGGLDYAGIHSVCVDPRNADRVAVAVSCGGVWITEDAGETWHCRSKGMFAEYMPPEQRENPNVQDPHRMVQCPAQPDVYWVQHHNGVFRTTDSATLWHHVPEVQPSRFGFGIAVHPHDGDTAWVVPAIKDEKRIPVDGKVVVSRTRDGGRSFEVLREGLPQDHAYDLTFRHALDVDGTGERLAFGSTTGSLWVSEDQGDRWTCVSRHLPPIHVVRFVAD